MKANHSNIRFIVCLVLIAGLYLPGQLASASEGNGALGLIDRNGNSANGSTGLSLSAIEQKDGDYTLGQEKQVLPNLFSSAIRMVVSLSIIIAVLLVVFYFTKPLLNKAGAIRGKEKVIRVLANNYVGGKKVISLVSVADHLLVVGITPTNISLLTRIDDPETVERFKATRDSNCGSASFVNQFKKFSRKMAGGDKMREDKDDL